MDRFSPRNSPRQLAIAGGFAEANSVFIVIKLQLLLQQKYCRDDYFLAKYIFSLQLLILFLDKIIVSKQEISLAHTREESVCATRSQINYICSAVYSSSFSSFTWQWNKLCFHVLYHRIGEILQCHIFKQLILFHSFTICSPAGDKEK